VAALAISGNPGVIEQHRTPGDGRVAIVTVVAAENVCRRLARSCYTVMTGPAVTRDCRVIDFIDGLPARCTVAIRTFTGRADMIEWFPGCCWQTGIRVTTGTGGLREHEVAADVAVFTGHVCMRPIEDETGGEVIEPRVRYGATGK